MRKTKRKAKLLSLTKTMTRKTRLKTLPPLLKPHLLKNPRFRRLEVRTPKVGGRKRMSILISLTSRKRIQLTKISLRQLMILPLRLKNWKKPNASLFKKLKSTKNLSKKLNKKKEMPMKL